MSNTTCDAYTPNPAEIIAYQQESPTIFTLTTQFLDKKPHRTSFYPGQFNMIYCYGVGEVAISIASDPQETQHLSHTIRAVGRTTRALRALRVGDHIGIRGPYGRGWPLELAKGRDILIITGGLGCAPTVSVINYVLARRHEFGALTILQGVKHSDDLIFQKQYDAWQKSPNTSIHIAANFAGPQWPWRLGYVTDMLQSITLNPQNTIAMMCGPELMMRASITALLKQGMPEDSIYLSMERNMACGIGQCGHCQYGGYFICKDGPVMAYSMIKDLFYVKGL